MICHLPNWKRKLVSFLLTAILFVASGLAADSVRVDDDISRKKKPKKPAVSYTQRSFQIKGKSLLLLSGSIHYMRVPPSDWNNTFQVAKELGLNAIQTYVTWNEHEPVPGGELQWEGYRDLNRFIELAAANDLYVILRIGPYICGEYYFGGIPLWMRNVRDEDGRQIECFRCSDPLWQREMKRWVTTVVDKVRPQLASNGGPIIWMQVENEYDPDDEYLEWAVAMARNITTEIPWSLCGHNITQCNQLNGFHEEDAIEGPTQKKSKVLCTINGFWVDNTPIYNQPSPTFFQKLWPINPTQPAAWTEDQGWFDIWKMGKRVRSTSDQLYGMARFFAHGGSYHNFYVLTGGNHYERRAGRDATTAYAPDTAIDNLLLRHEPRFHEYRKFFKTIRSLEKELLEQAVPVAPIPLNSSSIAEGGGESTAELHKYGDAAFLSNFGDSASEGRYFDYDGHSYYLPNHTVVVLKASSRKVLFNTSETARTNELKLSLQAEKKIPVTKWLSFQEKVGYGAIRNDPQSSPEQLNITDNKSDYMWYTFSTRDTGNISVQAIGWGGLQYVYVNGAFSDVIDRQTEHNASISTGRLLKDSAQLENKKRENAETKSAAMGLSYKRRNRIDIFSVAMGMSTVVSPQTGKGIEKVYIGQNKRPQTKFATAWKLKGEELEIYTKKGAARVEWRPMPSSELHPKAGLLWLKGSFEIPKTLLPFVGGAQPHQTALVVNLEGMIKGVAYVNGFNIGRYWLAPGECQGDCAPPRHGPHCFLHWAKCGEPTQTLYHVPFEVLKSSGNTLTLFEEGPSLKPRNLDEVFLEIVHNHRT